MSILPAADAAVLAALDFEPEIPCEALAQDGHPTTGDHPADYMYRRTCPVCGAARTYPVCEVERLALLSARFVRSDDCGHVATPAEFGPTYTPIRRQS